MKNRTITCATICLLAILFIIEGCKKFLEVDDPRDKVAANYAFNSDNSAIAVTTGLLYNIQLKYGQGLEGLSLTCAATADDLKAAAGSSPYAYFLNNSGDAFWGKLYGEIYKCNAAIEGLEKSTKLSPYVKQQLLGEAKFIRAFTYFYLVNLFGEIPLLLTTNFEVNSKASRVSSSRVYESIISDLKGATEMLSQNYLDSDVKTISHDRIRPNKAAAQALLARVYLFVGDWKNAEATSTLLINNSNFAISNNLSTMFLKNSKEAIWQLDPFVNDFSRVFRNTLDARYFVLDDVPNDSDRPVWVSEFLVDAFEPGDARFVEWVGKASFNGTDFYYPFKYKLNKPGQEQQEYLMVLRIAEQYLIRAESKINSGDIAGGVDDLNLLRSNRTVGTIGNPGSLPMLPSTLSIVQARFAVEHERQVELFTEWGHRWLDLKRTGRVDHTMSTLSPKKDPNWIWQNFKQFWPTPEADRRLNENLGQTPGWPN